MQNTNQISIKLLIASILLSTIAIDAKSACKIETVEQLVVAGSGAKVSSKSSKDKNTNDQEWERIEEYCDGEISSLDACVLRTVYESLKAGNSLEQIVADCTD